MSTSPATSAALKPTRPSLCPPTGAPTKPPRRPAQHPSPPAQHPPTSTHLDGCEDGADVVAGAPVVLDDVQAQRAVAVHLQRRRAEEPTVCAVAKLVTSSTACNRCTPAQALRRAGQSNRHQGERQRQPVGLPHSTCEWYTAVATGHVQHSNAVTVRVQTTNSMTWQLQAQAMGQGSRSHLGGTSRW